MSRYSEDDLPFHAGDKSPSLRYRSPRAVKSPFMLPLPNRVDPRALLSPRRAPTLLKYGIPCTLFLLLVGLLYWEPHVEISFYNRSWVQQEILAVPPLGGCFSPRAISHSYNVTDALYGPRRTEVHAGTPLQFGFDCYDFAGTIPAHKREPAHGLHGDQRVQYHTYWRTDLAAFSARQEWMLKSFFATQDTSRSRLVLWSNGDLSHNPVLQKWLRLYPEAFVLREVNYAALARGTELEGSELLKVSDARAWIDGDLVRLLVLWAYGGVWIDMDSLLTRDLAPLLEHEFVTQWDCYGECPLRCARPFQPLPLTPASCHSWKFADYMHSLKTKSTFR